MLKFDDRKFLFVLILLHLAIVLPLAPLLNIWADEASTLYSTGSGFLYALRNAASIEKQAPLYFWILSLWRAVDDSVIFARLLSVVFSIAAIIFFSRLARKLFDSKAAIFLTAFFALHPYLVWTSLEIRLYSLILLLSILILDLFFETFLERADEKNYRRKEILFVIVSVIALYTNYYLGFLLAGCFGALLVLRKWREAKKYFLLMLAAGVCFLPQGFAVTSHLAHGSTAYQVEKSLPEGARLLWNYFLTFILPTEIFPSTSGEISAFSFFRLWLVRLAILTALIVLVKRRKIFDEKILAFGAICAVIAGFLLVPYFLLGAKYMAIRHATVLFIPSILFAAAVIKQVFSGNRKDAERKDSIYSAYILTFCSAALIAVFFAYSIFNLYPKRAKRGDWARVAAVLQANEKPDQPVIIFPAYDALALPVYYKGANKILPDERFFDWDFEAPPGSADSAKRQTEFIISEIPAQANEVWLLTDESCETNERCRPLENFIEANYNIVETRMFYLEKLRLLRKK